MIPRSRDVDALAYMRAVNPFPAEELRESVGEDLLARAMREAISAGETPGQAIPVGDRVASRPARRLAFAAGIAVLAVLAAIAALRGSAEPVPPAYGAELVRFAESTPLLLLDEPGWRVEDAYELGYGPYMPRGSQGEGSMEFVTGKAVPDESIRINPGKESVTGMLPAGVRQRKVELHWRKGDLQLPGSVHLVRLPVLGTQALVDTHAGRITIATKGRNRVIEPGKPGDRQMLAVWAENGYMLELRAAVPNLAAFEERLSWLIRVDSQTWLDAMPAKVVKAADHDAVVHEMLERIPVPSAFTPAVIPNEGLTTNRYLVGGAVTSTVSCLWFRQWGEARRSGDHAAEREAERAMATSRHWPILREMAKEGAYPETIWKLAREMPSGYRVYAGHKRRLLPQAEALGCARRGIPVLPWKQRLQRERDGT